MPVETTTAGTAVLEIERFEWAGPERIELVGYWSGLRGRRFVRPTLVLKREGEQRRLLAILEHKPWAAHEGEEWTAAFKWTGEVAKFESAELNVGSSIDLELPVPRMRPGKPRRFRQRVVARDASRDGDAPSPRLPTGIVSDAPAKTEEPKLSRAEALKRAKEAAVPSKAKAEPEPTLALDAPVAAKPDATAVADPPVATDPPDAPDPGEGLRAELEAGRTDTERIRAERETFRRERDQALAKLRTVRQELEAERQAREKAVADARAEERASGNRMLHEGAELRASVERQREIAYLERDDAKKERDDAIAARDQACDERDAALAASKEARRERKEAFAERDRAMKLSQRADADRVQALDERDDAATERETAVRERDEILRAHERDLPVHPPKPRFLPDDHEQRSDFDIWGPRISAVAVLFFCAFIVLRLFGCG
ncbi:MAG TPA: hypothetical protein VF066_15430 [Thermoleophilaceae bacterium]